MTLLLVAQIVLGITVFISVFNSGWVAYLVLKLRCHEEVPATESLGKAAVFLCLRGADPSLASCLDRLMSQDHPNYDVMIVVDSVDDPAWPIVQTAIEKHGNDRLRAWPLAERLTTCGLKNSSLIQLLDQLDGSHDVIALADADLESHSTWLRALVGPLSDPSIGLTFGNRWFLPSEMNTGSLVRHVWNAPGVIVMSAFKIPWAGSLAIQSSLVESGMVREKLATAIIDDGPLRVAAKQQGLRTMFVPSLIMANREICDLRFAYNFIRRQLTWTRTYFANLWVPMLTYHLLATLTAVVAHLVVLIGATRGDWPATILGLIGCLVSLGSAVMHHLVIDATARRAIRRQGGSAPRPAMREYWLVLAHLSLAAIIGLIASFVATFARRIVWRGVTYEIRGPWKVQLIEDNPFHHATPPQGQPQTNDPTANISL